MRKITSGESSIESTSRKRRRTEDGQSTENSVAPGTSEPLTRDITYYMGDGDCIIRVENTLFKVHKAFLSRDSSVFAGMFSLPQNPEDSFNVEGVSDQQPITLFGETAEKFRSLMWILYALPHQIETLLLEKVSRLTELISIAEITNKYHFEQIGSWAVKTLQTMIGQKTVAPMYLERILRMVLVFDDKQVFEAFLSTLTAGLMDQTLPPTEMLIIADRLQIRELQGVAYYAQLMALQQNNSHIIVFPVGCSLSKDQRVRLLAGHWSLVRRWERLLDTPVFQQAPSCPDPQHCRSNWNFHWRVCAQSPNVTRYGSADVLRKMQAMEDLLNTSAPLHFTLYGLPSALHPISDANPHRSLPCGRTALAATKKVIDDIRASLPDVFSEGALGLTQGSL